MAGTVSSDYGPEYIDPATGKPTEPDPFTQDLWAKIRAMRKGANETFTESVGRAGATLNIADLMDPYTYKPDAAAWNYQQGVSPLYSGRAQQAMDYGRQFDFTPGARAAQEGTRNEQQNALSMLRDYATGNESVAREQGNLEREAMVRQIAGQVAGRPYDPAAMRGGQMAMARAGTDLAAKTQVAAMQEKLAAQQALMQGATGMRSGDLTQFGQESALEKSLRDYQMQKDTAAQQWWKLGLGEKAADLATMQDWEKQQIARNQYLQNQGARFALGPEAGNVGQGTDWGSLVGGGLTALSSLAMLFSDERAKTGIVPSGEQCKRALESANAPLRQFLGDVGTQPGAYAPAPGAAPLALDRPDRIQLGSQYVPAPSAEVPSPQGTMWSPKDLQPLFRPTSSTYQPTPEGWVTDAPLENYVAQPTPMAQPRPPRIDVPAPQPAPQPTAADYGVTPAEPQRVYAPGGFPAPAPAPQPAPQPQGNAVGFYGHDLIARCPRCGQPAKGGPGAQAAPPAAGQNSIITPAPLDATQPSAPPAGGGSWQQAPPAPPAGGGSWQQSPPASAPEPVGGGSWQQTPPAPAPAPDFSGLGILGDTFTRQRIGAIPEPMPQPISMPVDTTLRSRVGAIPEPMPQPLQLQRAPAQLNPGLIYSDERCKQLEGEISDAIAQGSPAMAGLLNVQLRNLKAQEGLQTAATIDEPTDSALGEISSRAGKTLGGSLGMGSADISAPMRWATDTANETPSDIDLDAAGAPKTGGVGANGMQAMGGIGKGLGAVLGALMPKPRQPTRFRDSGPVQQQITPNVMGGIAQSLLSDERAKGGMGPTEGRIDEFLSEIEPTQFRYKQPFAAQYGAGKRTGVIAQDVAKSELGDDMVIKDPKTGMLMLDTRPDKFNPLVLASLAHLAHRLERVEGGK